MSRPRMPSAVDAHRSVFDRFADAVSRFTSRAWFFAACVLLVIAWAPSYLLVGDVDTYQLLINTPTTIVTFLLVGLAQNTQARADAALQHKLNAIAAALAEVASEAGVDPVAVDELRAAVGLEERESA